MKPAAIWSRNCIYFYLSFFSAGTQGIITQLFVRKYYPENKELLLTIILILGALAYIFGIWLSGRRLGVSSHVIKGMLAFNLAGFIAIVTAKNLVLYIVSYCIACFSCNFAYNYLDHRFVSGLEPGGLGVHVKSMLVYQMLAFVLSPLFFSVCVNAIVPMLCILPAIAAVFCLPAIFTVSPETEPLKDGTQDRTPFSLREKIFIAYVLLFQAVVALAISMMTYLISEYYHFTDYAVKSGILLMVMSLLSALAVIILRPPRAASGKTGTGHAGFMEIERAYFRAGLQAAVILLFASMIVLLIARLSQSFPYVLAVCSVLGIAYGLFLNSTRRFAGAMSGQNGRKRLLTAYNNLQSIASLMGYCITVLFWLLTRQPGGHFYFLLLAGAVGILMVELALIAAWVLLSRQQGHLKIKNENRGGEIEQQKHYHQGGSGA